MIKDTIGTGNRLGGALSFITTQAWVGSRNVIFPQKSSFKGVNIAYINHWIFLGLPWSHFWTHRAPFLCFFEKTGDAKFLAVSLSRRLPDLHVVPRLCGQTASPASQVAQGLTRCNAGTCQVSIKLLKFHEIQIPCRLIYM
jgi:hypothetical protein